jgi:hypothetical protein
MKFEAKLDSPHARFCQTKMQGRYSENVFARCATLPFLNFAREFLSPPMRLMIRQNEIHTRQQDGHPNGCTCHHNQDCCVF